MRDRFARLWTDGEGEFGVEYEAPPNSSEERVYGRALLTGASGSFRVDFRGGNRGYVHLASNFKDQHGEMRILSYGFEATGNPEILNSKHLQMMMSEYRGAEPEDPWYVWRFSDGGTVYTWQTMGQWIVGGVVHWIPAAYHFTGRDFDAQGAVNKKVNGLIDFVLPSATERLVGPDRCSTTPT